MPSPWTIAYNDAVRNIKRLIVEDRAECTRQFPEGRGKRWFFDDYQDKNGKWHSALAPPWSHWPKYDAVDVEPWWSPELDEKVMRLAGKLIAGDVVWRVHCAWWLWLDSTEYILLNRKDITDKERSYRYMMIDKEIKRARKMARAELEHMNGPSEKQARGVKRKIPKVKGQRHNVKAKANAKGDAKAKCKATSKGKSHNLTEKAKPKAKGKAKVHSRTRRQKA